MIVTSSKDSHTHFWLWKWFSCCSRQHFRMFRPDHLCSVNKPRGSHAIWALIFRRCLFVLTEGNWNFYSKIGLECLHQLQERQRGAAPPTTADRRRQPAVNTPQFNPASHSRQSNTGGTCTMSPACLRGSREDQSWKTKVIVASKHVPKHRQYRRTSTAKVKNLSATWNLRKDKRLTMIQLAADRHLNEIKGF